MTRVVLGSGPSLRKLAHRLGDRTETVHVVSSEERTVEDAREAGVEVTVGDPTNPDELADIRGVDGVVVASNDAAETLSIARAARAAYPEAVLVAYRPAEAGDIWSAVEQIVDKVVDPGRSTAEYLMERIGDRGLRMRQLRKVLRRMETLAVVAHDNPDPDAIASAVALGRVANASGCAVDICYYGNITHQENQAFVNLLNFDLVNLEPGTAPDTDGIALVDHSRPGVNDGLPPDTAVDIVIDHHPPRAPVEARFVDLRSEVGATSTLLVDYLEHFGIALETDVATGLLFGIRVDTREFTREVSPQDFEAASRLLPHADLGTLERIESPSMSAETLEIIAAAIANRRVEDEVLLTCVGNLGDRGALAQAADRLVLLEGITTVLVYGMKEGDIYISARAQGTDIDLGEVLREAFGRIGSAGGHADMAGAQIRLGVLEAVEEREESLIEIVETVVSNRFFDAMQTSTDRRVTDVTVQPGVVDEYLLSEEELSEIDDEG